MPQVKIKMVMTQFLATLWWVQAKSERLENGTEASKISVPAKYKLHKVSVNLVRPGYPITGSPNKISGF